jgi:hypothetical protein
MKPARLALQLAGAAFFALALGAGVSCSGASQPTARQQSLDEWRSLTAPAAPLPRVFAKRDQIRFFFQSDSGVEAFIAHRKRLRIPAKDYKVSSAVLRWDQRLSRLPDHDGAWREATVIAGAEWHQLVTNMIDGLAPKTPGHGVYYQAFLLDRLVYRDAGGAPHLAAPGERPKDVIIERGFR